MSNPAQVATQVRFALSQLPRHNAHYVFEQLAATKAGTLRRSAHT